MIYKREDRFKQETQIPHFLNWMLDSKYVLLGGKRVLTFTELENQK